MPVDLTPILPHLPPWLMVLFRLTGIFVLAPVLGSSTVPRQIKVFLALGLALCVYPMLLGVGQIQLPAPDGLLWNIAPAIGLELLIGYIIGYCCSLPLVAMSMGGHMIDQQLGLGLAGIFNPELDGQSGVIAEFLFILGLAIFLILGGHEVMLIVLISSFEQVPLGGFSSFDALAQMVVGLLSVMVELSMRIAAPLLCLIFLETVAMGFIARTVPQMNILSVGFTLRILGGASFMVLCIAGIGQAYEGMVLQTLRELMRFFTM